MTTTDRDARAAEGARNLLSGCAGVAAGDTLLIVAEPVGGRHYTDAAVAVVEQEARALGASVKLVRLPVPEGPEALADHLARDIAAADHTIFLSRIGDQLRFSTLPGAGTKSISYAIDIDWLASSFGRTPYTLFQEVHDLVTERLLRARSYTIRCPLGTDVVMDLPAPTADARATRVADFGVRNFPVMIVPAVSATDLNGRIVFSHAFASTYIHIYDDPLIPLDTPIEASIVDGRIVDLKGEASIVSRVQTQFERVGGLFGGDAYALNSWHTGINATTFFPQPALSDFDRWASISFGSPRYTHFHMCGNAPGEISGQVFDATISFDDEPIWQDGVLTLLGEAERERLCARHSVSRDVLDGRLDIGVDVERLSAVAA